MDIRMVLIAGVFAQGVLLAAESKVVWPGLE